MDTNGNLQTPIDESYVCIPPLALQQVASDSHSGCSDGTTSVTISIPVTARFDGFECDKNCAHFCGGCTLVGVLAHANENPSLPYIIGRQPTWVRPRWCCETFGIG